MGVEWEHLKELGEEERGVLQEINPELSGAEIRRRYDLGNRCLCWYEEGVAAGYVWAYINDGEGEVKAKSVADTSLGIALKRGDGYWWDGYVAPRYRKRGIFRGMVKEFLAYAAGRGAKRVIGVIDYSNAASIKSHRGAGFELERRVLHVRVFGKDWFLSEPDEIGSGEPGKGGH